MSKMVRSKAAVVTAARRASMGVGGLEVLEGRKLFAVTVVSPVPDQNVRPDAANTLFQLSTVFATNNLDSVTGTVVSLPVAYGSGTSRVSSSINMELFSETPRTAQNFLNYVTSNKYDNTIVDNVQTGASIQAGGYKANLDTVVAAAPIANEINLSPKDVNGRINTRGTVAMSKGASNGADSATSQWFINLADNPAFDTKNGGYTTFARLFSGSLATAQAISALPRLRVDDGSLTDVPVADATLGTDSSNLVVFSDAIVVTSPKSYFTYSISSSDNPTTSVRAGRG